jgi:type 1 glutamine amidotransferase
MEIPVMKPRLHPLLHFCLMIAGLAVMDVNAQAETNAWRILVFSKTLGYRHASITNGIEAIRQLGAQHGFAVTATEDANAFTPTNLAAFQAVVFLSVTGDVLLTEQEHALSHYVENGGGLVSIHGAAFGPSACEDHWNWYHEVCGCAFTNHSAIVPATVLIQDATQPSTQGLPAQWQRTDEWYNFTGSPRGTARVLVTVDEGTYTGGTMGVDHPITWCRQVGKGRFWYTAMGHSPEAFDEPLLRQHLLGGIQTAAGMKPATLSPNPRSRQE